MEIVVGVDVLHAGWQMSSFHVARHPNPVGCILSTATYPASCGYPAETKMEIIVIPLNPDSYEAWMQRPVYLVQCRTWALAAKLNFACSRFRCLPAYRDEQSLKERKAVSDLVRAQRKLIAIKKGLIAQLDEVSQHNALTGFFVDVEMTISLRQKLHALQRQDMFAH